MVRLQNNEPCPHCGRYANRGLSVDAVILKGDKVLLVQRGAEPDKGFWGTPGGYVEWDEPPEETVSREVREETGLTAKAARLVGVFGKPNRHPKQVVNLVYIATTQDDDPRPGDDAQDVKWFPVNRLPDDMALDHRQNIEAAIKTRG